MERGGALVITPVGEAQPFDWGCSLPLAPTKVRPLGPLLPGASSTRPRPSTGSSGGMKAFIAWNEG
eukprot:5174332-Alexandrium_andersonii.AAC.1